MTDTLKNLAKGVLGSTSAPLYTVPANTIAIVKEIILANKTAGAVTATVTFDNIIIVPAKSIPANDALVIELHSIIEAGKVIAGSAGAGASIDYYISGIEVA